MRTIASVPRNGEILHSQNLPTRSRIDASVCTSANFAASIPPAQIGEQIFQMGFRSFERALLVLSWEGLRAYRDDIPEYHSLVDTLA
jgi:hypothetical protein